MTPERACELFSYNPETGELRWRVATSRRVKVGAIAGRPSAQYRKSGNTYRNVAADGSNFLAHRLIWLIMTGKWPASQIDHIDGDGLNNAWTNLRQATHAQNSGNRRRSKNNTTGFKGVVTVKGGRYWAQFRGRSLGYFAAAEDAHTAYKSAAAAFFGEFSNGG